MQRRELITGPNFSGRSDALKTLARDPSFAPASFFVGPYAEAALSGLSSTLADEIHIYRAENAKVRRPTFSPIDFAKLLHRKPQTLSGGEQVLLALHCFSQSAHSAVAIDTALEQLDGENRAAALSYLCGNDGPAFNVALIDNRLDAQLAHWSCRAQDVEPRPYPCDLTALANELAPQQADAIVIHDLHFRYRQGRPIFQGVDLTFEPGTAHRLLGPNGAGKTTLLKILVGVLSPLSGRLSLGGATYEPARTGNRAIALATQNPDHQWCGATLREDIARRRSAFARRAIASLPSDARMASLARRLGFSALDLHLYELPLAARKRLSWLWPFSGALPWIVLDEPTIGQDREIRAQLAAVIGRLCALGHGVIFVTHDDDFAAQVPHRALAIEATKIKAM
jgi:energy-coupling factor transporter ATP-binding protein EcfA2